MNDSKQPLSRRIFIKAGVATVLTSATAVYAMDILPQPKEAAIIKGNVRKFNLTTTAFTGSPDGRERELWGYNGQFPGPEIRVKEGEMVRIKVDNKLPAPTSIHWHGMKQRGTWDMDGVTPISRPAIKPGESFEYAFKAEPAGTHWYHSHTGIQYSEGLYGPLIVEARNNPYQYDREQVLMIGDWFVEPSDTIMKNIVGGVYRESEKPAGKPAKRDLGDVPFQSFIFNGKGQLPDNDVSKNHNFTLNKGETVRFRIVNTSSTYMFKLQFDNHKFTIIETDGQPIKQTEADCLTIDIGERFDILLTADQSGTQYIRASTLDGQEGTALLQYTDDESGEIVPASSCTNAISAANLVASEPVNLPDTGFRAIELTFGGSMMPYFWSINGKRYPDIAPVKIKKGETIRFILKNPTGMSHPFHLHGHYFRVLGRSGELNLTDPALKDTVTIPPKDNLVVQFDADNPGKWFFHCHIEWHLGTGMAVVVEYEDI